MTSKRTTRSSAGYGKGSPSGVALAHANEIDTELPLGSMVPDLESGGLGEDRDRSLMRVNSLSSNPSSPLRGTENLKRGRERFMSGEDIGDLLDSILELVWYRRPDRLAALEKEHTNLFVVLLVLTWYASAIFAITTSKKIMLVLPMPYTLCASQFTTATVVMFLIGRQYGTYNGPGGGGDVKKRGSGSGGVASSSKSGDNAEIDSIARMSGRKKGGPGHVTNSGFAVGGVMEAPILRPSVSSLSREDKDALGEIHDFGMLGVFTLPPSHMYTRILYMTALSYTCGFLFTNMAFSVVTASFAETVKSGEPISSVIFGWFILGEKSNTLTYCTLIPICVGVALSCFHDESFNPKGFLCAAASNIMFSLRAVLAKKLIKSFPSMTDEITMFGHVSLLGLIMLVPLALYIEGPSLVEKFFLELDSSYVSSRLELLFLLLCNTLAYTSYNTMSFLVLRRTHMVTHAVLNCFRRVFIIVFTCHYFQVPISNFNLAGIGVAVTGVIAFGWSKSSTLIKGE